MKTDIFFRDINFLLELQNTRVFSQKEEISNFQAVLNLYRQKFKKFPSLRINFLNLILKFSFHFMEKIPSLIILFSTLDNDLFRIYKKKKKAIIYNSFGFFRTSQINQLSFFHHNLLSGKVSPVSVLLNFFFRCIQNLEKSETNFLFRHKTVGTCFSILSKSFYFFFDQSILEHAFTVIKGKLDDSIDLFGFRKKLDKSPGTGVFFIDQLSIWYKIALYKLKINRKSTNEATNKENSYFLRNLRITIPSLKTEKKTKFFRNNCNPFFFSIRPKILRFKDWSNKKKKLELEKYSIKFRVLLLVRTFKDQVFWLISKLIDYFHTPLFSICVHTCNHILLSSFFCLILGKKTFGIFQGFFFLNFLRILNIDNFSNCLENFIYKISKNSKNLVLWAHVKISEFTSFYFSNLSLKINSWFFTNFLLSNSRFIGVFKKIIRKIFLINTVDLIYLKIPKNLFYQKKLKFATTYGKKKRIEDLKTFLIQIKENFEREILLKEFLQSSFQTNLKVRTILVLISLLDSNQAFGFKIILLDKYLGFFSEFSNSEANKFVIIKGLLDIGSNLFFLKTFAVSEKFFLEKIFLVNQIGRDILRKKSLKNLNQDHIIDALVYFKKKLILNKYWVKKDKKRFRTYIQNSSSESKNFIIKAYSNVLKAEKLWRKLIKGFQLNVLENLFLLSAEIIYFSENFPYFTRIMKKLDFFMFFFNFLISFWENFLESKESFFFFRVNTRKNHFLFKRLNPRFGCIYFFLIFF